MNLEDITVHVLAKNESYYIRPVLAPLLKHFQRVIVFDTGSTDGTAEIAEESGAEVHRKGNMTPSGLGTLRTEMCKITKTHWVFLADSDELYNDEVFVLLEQQEMPTGKRLGFTEGQSLDVIDGKLVLMADRYNRAAIYPKETVYIGAYPFESPVQFGDPKTFHYFSPIGTFYHLHRLNRSPLDKEVYMRKRKQKLYSMQSVKIPIVGPISLPELERYIIP